jgi:ABC-2 type transport system ATP-binding protein
VTEEVVLRTKGLVKRFGSITAVDGLDLEVRRGEVVCLLGPNGAGKSTTIGMVLGLITPTAGTGEVLGRDVRVRREDALAGVGAMLEVTSFYPYLSGRDNLVSVALLRGGGALGRVHCSRSSGSGSAVARSSARIRSGCGSASVSPPLS